MTTQSRSLRLADQVAAQPCSWPGLYQRVAVTSDGQYLCPDCCRTERGLIGTTTGSDGWCVVAVDILYEDDELSSCSHCGCQLPAPMEPDDGEQSLTAAERNPLLARGFL